MKTLLVAIAALAFASSALAYGIEEDDEAMLGDGGEGGPGQSEVTALMEQAMALDEKKDYAGAVGKFEQIVELSPNDAGMWNNLGVATMRHGTDLVNKRRRVQGKKMFLKAAEHYRKAIEIDENTYYAAENLKGVLAALQANFRVSPTKEDIALLEESGIEYDEEEINRTTEEDQARRRAEAQDQDATAGASGSDDQFEAEELGMDEPREKFPRRRRRRRAAPSADEDGEDEPPSPRRRRRRRDQGGEEGEGEGGEEEPAKRPRRRRRRRAAKGGDL